MLLPNEMPLVLTTIGDTNDDCLRARSSPHLHSVTIGTDFDLRSSLSVADASRKNALRFIRKVQSYDWPPLIEPSSMTFPFRRG